MLLSTFISMLFFSYFHSGFTENLETKSLTIQLPDLDCKSGAVMIAVFSDSETFLSDNAFFKEKYACDQVKNQEVVLDLPEGRYGIAVYHDKNGDGKLNKNFVGYPTEPFGFSNNPRIIVGAPSWNDTVIQHRGNSPIEIRWN